MKDKKVELEDKIVQKKKLWYDKDTDEIDPLNEVGKETIMLRTKLKKGLFGVIATLCLTCTTVPAFAANTSFDVTVGGTGTQDPLSPRVKKDDGEQIAYFRGKTISSTTRYIDVKSYNKNNAAITTTSARIQNSNLGVSLQRKYSKYAPGDQYYYLKATTTGSRVRVTGVFCP